MLHKHFYIAGHGIELKASNSCRMGGTACPALLWSGSHMLFVQQTLRTGPIMGNISCMGPQTFFAKGQP